MALGNCTDCGHVMSSSATFCTHCGCRRSPIYLPKSSVCRVCNGTGKVKIPFAGLEKRIDERDSDPSEMIFLTKDINRRKVLLEEHRKRVADEKKAEKIALRKEYKVDKNGLAQLDCFSCNGSGKRLC